jgi:hypothetical protein
LWLRSLPALSKVKCGLKPKVSGIQLIRKYCSAVFICGYPLIEGKCSTAVNDPHTLHADCWLWYPRHVEVRTPLKI